MLHLLNLPQFISTYLYYLPWLSATIFTTLNICNLPKYWPTIFYMQVLMKEILTTIRKCFPEYPIRELLHVQSSNKLIVGTFASSLLDTKVDLKNRHVLRQLLCCK